MEYVTLNNGVKMPLLGYGTFQIHPDITEKCVLNAISVGYRLIDTAQGYFNESGVGAAVKKCGVPREELFITTKIWITNAGRDKGAASIEASLKSLQTDYIDLCLIHQPFNDYYGAYRAMEQACREGKIRAIGVSNFLPDRFIDLANFVEIKPTINQMETHVLFQQQVMQEILKKADTQLMAWSPLAQGRERLLQNDLLRLLGEKYSKTAAQVNLRFLIQSGICVIPKTVHIKRMRENFSVFDFSLTQEEMNQIRELDQNKSQFVDFCAPEVVRMFADAGKM